jgi:hypothetical protein
MSYEDVHKYGISEVSGGQIRQERILGPMKRVYRLQDSLDSTLINKHLSFCYVSRVLA